MPALLIADLHLVADPACVYRWQLFPWLRDTIKEEHVKTLCILGDMVDRKDNHPAALVNKLCDELQRTVKETGVEIVAMPGNHDWLKDGEEYWAFLRHIDGIQYPTKPWEHPDVKGPLAMFLPFSRDPVKDWKDMHSLEQYDFVFMHQTVKGAKGSTGVALDGEPLPDIFDGAGKIYSGDIHVPQIIGGIEYVGSPYHVHFGDNFKPRCVLLETKSSAVDLHVPNMPRRVMVDVRSVNALWKRLGELQRGDQVKVRLELTPEERYAWSKLRRDAVDMVRDEGMQLHGIELVAIGGDGKRLTHARARRLANVAPEEALSRYVEDEDLGGDALQVGMDLL